MKLIFEISKPNRQSINITKSTINEFKLNTSLLRKSKLDLPEIAEIDLARHYTNLSKRVFGVNTGFYPLGSCTMKYNSAINEEIVAYPEFANIHPLQPANTVQGCLQILCDAEDRICELTGMDAVTFQPAAGAHGEFTGLLLIKAYHKSRNDTKRSKIIVPGSAHGTNPASTVMCGFDIINVPSNDLGEVDINKLKEVLGEDTAGLMLTNPNTLGSFDRNILEITKLIHDAGGLNYYDGANLNAIMGICKPGAMGFDIIHLNLHKTMGTPHGGGGPGTGATGVKNILIPFLPKDYQVNNNNTYSLTSSNQSIGKVKSFYGNFSVVLKSLAYMYYLGGDGLKKASQMAVLNANYMKHKIEKHCKVATSGFCMHEFVMSLEDIKKDTTVSAKDFAKAMMDYNMHPPTMYFPLIVHEALMIEPTETESKETLDEACKNIIDLISKAYSNPSDLLNAPLTTPISRPDEVLAARNPKLIYTKNE